MSIPAHNSIQVLFVCMGNICRSPTAHGVFQQLVTQHKLNRSISVDSAGTHAYHVGAAPDLRAQVVAQRRGYDLSKLHARKVAAEDFSTFNYIVAMDKENVKDLNKICPSSVRHKITKLMSYSDKSLDEVPDPYYETEQQFEFVFDLIENACNGLLTNIKNKL